MNSSKRVFSIGRFICFRLLCGEVRAKTVVKCCYCGCSLSRSEGGSFKSKAKLKQFPIQSVRGANVMHLDDFRKRHLLPHLLQQLGTNRTKSDDLKRPECSKRQKQNFRSIFVLKCPFS